MGSKTGDYSFQGEGSVARSGTHPLASRPIVYWFELFRDNSGLDCQRRIGMVFCPTRELIMPPLGLVVAIILVSAPTGPRQSPPLREIEITSEWGGLGPFTRSALTIVDEGRGFHQGNRNLERRLIDELVSALDEPPIAEPLPSNLGLDLAWLQEKSEIVPLSYPDGRSAPSAEQKTLFRSSYTNPGIITKLVPNLFSYTRTDDYPRVEVIIHFMDGSGMTIRTKSQYAFMLPWEVVKEGESFSTYNAHVSLALAALMPEGATNRERMKGEGLDEQLSDAVMQYIEDDWNMLDAIDKVPGTLARLKTQYEVRRAEINSFHHPEYGKTWRRGHSRETNLHVELSKEEFPSNFCEQVILEYRGGEPDGLDAFLTQASDYEKLVFSLAWLNRYIPEHPLIQFRLLFIHNQSLGEKAMQVFASDMEAIGKNGLVKEVRKSQRAISLLMIGTTYAESYWLILPDKRMVLWRYEGRSGLLNWTNTLLRTRDCASYQGVTGGCVGALVTSEGVLEP